MLEQSLIAGLISFVIAMITYISSRKRNQAEAGDLISQSAVRLVESMEARVKDLEAQVKDLRDQVKELVRVGVSKDQRIKVLEEEVAWLFEQLSPEAQQQFKEKFQRFGFGEG